MNNHQIPKPEESLAELDLDTGSSVDDFIRELEEKEKDLHITADLQIEVEESDVEAQGLPDFVQDELKEAPPAAPAQRVPDAAPAQSGLKTQVYELQNEVTALQNKLRDLREERNEIQEKSDQRLKDFQNYKYRMDRERRGSHIDQIAAVTEKLLPAIDNLGRALEAAKKLEGEKSLDFQQFYDGIVMVNKQVLGTLASMGVEPIATVGETFDPNLHEAVAAEERDDVPANTILDEMLRGYRIGNRVIRHSMVKVTTAPIPARKTDNVQEAAPAAEMNSDPTEYAGLDLAAEAAETE
jgi:molecular chaperone GrpE